jgi:hypothetical protein
MKKQILKPCPIQELGFAEYQYFVETPEGEFLYFNNKKQAIDFIEFYHQYQEKNNAKSNRNLTV